MSTERVAVFSPDIPPDLEHAALIREEAFEWLELQQPGAREFAPGELLRMSGDAGRRDLITRIRQRGIGNQDAFSIEHAADALAILFLRSRGVKFGEAVAAIVREGDEPGSPEPRYGGIWNRLISIALKRLRRRVTARLFGAALFAVLRDSSNHANCLVIVRLHGRERKAPAEQIRQVSHDYVYQASVARPVPSCWVVSPFREILSLDRDQPPARSEITSRQFSSVWIRTELDSYELLVGTMNGATLSTDRESVQLAGRILDIVFEHFETFLQVQAQSRLEASAVPGPESVDDLQLWLVTQLIGSIYPGSLCEISEAGHSDGSGTVLAHSAAKPWEPAPWAPPKNLEMLSGYAARTGVPLVVPTVEKPWSDVIESVESEVRYLRSVDPAGDARRGFSALALPVFSQSGRAVGSLYVLAPQMHPAQLSVETRVLTVFSRIVGEVMERQRGAIHSADISARVAGPRFLRRPQFRAALHNLLERTSMAAADLEEVGQDVGWYMRLPFLLIAVHRPDSHELAPGDSAKLGEWLVRTLDHLEWKSFLHAQYPGQFKDYGEDSFVGELPGVGLIIALGSLVSKDDLDQIRTFPTILNRTTPRNSPVRLLGWVLDVPAQRIREAAENREIQGLADDIERWALDASTVIDEVAQSRLASDRGQWEASLQQIRKAIKKPAGSKNGYLHRLGADCSFSLGDWPGALRFAERAVRLSRDELGSGLVRSMCQEAEARLLLGELPEAWSRYGWALGDAPTHPMPRYYRGQGMLLVARLLRLYEDERRRNGNLDHVAAQKIELATSTLSGAAMEDLTAAAELLDRWGLIAESYLYRNYHLVPTLLGQGIAYLMANAPGPAASRIQASRRSFPKDDLFYREFIFAKCWEQGLHRRYGEFLLSDESEPIRASIAERLGGMI